MTAAIGGDPSARTTCAVSAAISDRPGKRNASPTPVHAFASPAKLNFRFVLGLILMRKRMIVYEDTRIEEGREIWQVRFKGRDHMMDLLNPRLDESQVLDVSNQLGEILNEEL